MFNTKKIASAVSVAVAMSSGSFYAAAFELEEIVVTAQKRAENLQDVPIAVYAVTGDDIKTLDASNLQSLTEHVAGAELFDDRGAGQPTWVIRGVGLSDFNSNNTPTAAVYYDEYYLTSNTLGGIGMFDIDRVEILKGPQGGLYGRNTSGGAVRVVSKAPQVGEGTTGHVTGSVGSWDKRSLDAAIGFDISDSAAGRIAVVTHQGGGWQDSLATPNDDEWGDSDFSAIRAQVAFELNDTTDLLIKVDAGRDNSETTLSTVTPINIPGNSNPFAFCDDAVAGNINLNTCTDYSNILNEFAFTPGDPGVLPSQQSSDGSEVMSSPINQLDNKWKGITIRLDKELSFATLTSITGYLDYNNKQDYDYDGSSLTLLHEKTRSDLTSWSQELRLVSNGSGDLNWLAGAMIGRDTVDEARNGFLNDNLFIIPTYSLRTFDQETKSWAVYGQVEYDLTETVTLNGSLRYTDEEKDLNDYSHQDFGLLGGGFFIHNADRHYKLESNFSGHVGIDWAFADDMMVYAKITQGFKSGGMYGGFAFDEGELDPFKEETVLSYEVGFKSELLDRSLRLNAAAYYYDYQDVQGFTDVFSTISNTTLTKLDNLGDATHKGAELEMIWLPGFSEGFTLEASVAWMDAEFTDTDTLYLDPNLEVSPLEGKKRNFAPELSASLQARYEQSLTDNVLGSVQLNYSWRDDPVSREAVSTPFSETVYKIDGYGLMNLRVGIASQDLTWEAALMGKNLTGEEYTTRAGGSNVGSWTRIPGKPRSWSLEVTYNF